MGQQARWMRILIDRRPTDIRVGPKGGPIYRPDIVMSVDQASGYIFATTVVEPHEGSEAVVGTAQETLDKLGHEAPGWQGFWVVRQEGLIAVLPTAFPGARILLESDDDFVLWDEAYLSLHQHMGGGGGMLPYLWRADTTPEDVAQFFEAAARYYQSRPWRLISDDELLSGPDPVPDAPPLFISVLGAAGISRGLGLFDSRADFERVLSDQVPEGVVFVGFSPARRVPHTVASEAEQYGWRIANQSAFPTLLRARRDEPAPLRRHDLRRATAGLHLVVEAVAEFRKTRAQHRRR